MQNYLPQEEIQDINKYFNPKYGISFKCTKEHAQLVRRVMKLNDDHLRKMSEQKTEANLSKSKYFIIRWFYKPRAGWYDYFSGCEMICRRVTEREVDAVQIYNMQQELKPGITAIPFKTVYRQGYICGADNCAEIDSRISYKHRIDWLLVSKGGKICLENHKYIKDHASYVLKINVHQYMNISADFLDTDIFFEEQTCSVYIFLHINILQ